MCSVRHPAMHVQSSSMPNVPERHHIPFLLSVEESPDVTSGSRFCAQAA